MRPGTWMQRCEDRESPWWSLSVGQSGRVRNFINEEMEFLGPMRSSEVEEVQLRIVAMVRQLEQQGQITIVRGDYDDELV